MPSSILTPASGAPFPIISGNYWSGQTPRPVGGVNLKLHPEASGNAYISLSGGSTVNSGGFLLSGANRSDGMILSPGDTYFVPKLAFTVSGVFNIYATCDAACSGQARLYWEIY